MRPPWSARRRAPAQRLAIALLVGAAAVGATSGAVDDRQTRTLALDGERSLSLEATNAVVRLSGEERSDVRLEVVRRAPSAAALTRFPLVVREDVAGVQVTVVQADGGTAADLQAEITMTVPERARVSSVRIGEGRLDVHDFHGWLTADVRRGPIAATRVSGTLRLETGIGSIDVQRARLSADGLLRLRAFNGDIRLALLERPADARVMALALNGTVQSSIPLTMKTAWGPRWGEATLGRGAPVISLDVVTGRIRIEAP